MTKEQCSKILPYLQAILDGKVVTTQNGEVLDYHQVIANYQFVFKIVPPARTLHVLEDSIGIIRATYDKSPVNLPGWKTVVFTEMVPTCIPLLDSARKELTAMLVIMTAFVEGSDIEYKHPDDVWKQEPELAFISDASYYRIKPEPRIVFINEYKHPDGQEHTKLTNSSKYSNENHNPISQ